MQNKQIQDSPANMHGQQLASGIDAPTGGFGLKENPNYVTSPIQVHIAGEELAAPVVSPIDPEKIFGSGGAIVTKRKAVVISTIITLVVLVLTSASVAYFARNAAKKESPNAQIKTQDITLQDAAINNLPQELEGAKKSLFVNGDIITRGDLKISNGDFVTIIKAQANANQTFTLPTISGTICLDSNNCNFATSDQLAILQTQLGQIVTPGIPASSFVNNQQGAVTIQGVPNRISVIAGGGTIQIATPQDIATGSSPTFATVTLTALDCSGNVNGGALTAVAGVISCSDDDGGAGSPISGSGANGQVAYFDGVTSLTSSTNFLFDGTDLTLNSAASELRILEAAGGVFFGTIDVADLTVDQTYTFPDASGMVCLSSGNCAGVGGTGDVLSGGQNGPLTVGTNNATALTLETGNTPRLTISSVGIVTISSLNSAGVVHTNGSGDLSTGDVVLGSETSGNYIASLGSVTGLTLGGTNGIEGAIPTLNVDYGSTPNTAVQGNTQITCAAGTGQLSGGGNSFALGLGGACSDISISTTPSFTSVNAATFIGALTGNASTATALAGDPTDCVANQFATAIAANGNLTCAALVDADIPDSITINLAATATALAADPSDCAANQFANGISANGNLQCSALTDGDIPNSITIDLAATATALASDPSDCAANQFAVSIAANGNLGCAAIAANNLPATAADLGAADITIDLGNTNGSFVTNLILDGTITATNISIGSQSFNDLTGNGLQLSGNSLSVLEIPSKGIQVGASGIGLINCAAGQILKYNVSNEWACSADDDSGSGAVSSLNGLSGGLTIQGTNNEITVSDNGSNTITIGLPDDVTIGSDLTVTDTLSVNGADVALSVAHHAEIAGSLGVGNATNLLDPSQLFGGVATLTATLQVAQTVTDLTTTDFVVDTTNFLVLNPVANATSTVVNSFNILGIQAGNTNDLGTLYNGYFSTGHDGDGTITSIISLQSTVTATGAGDIGSASGLNIQINNSGTGTIGNAGGIFIGSANGDINDVIGIEVENQTAGSNRNVNLVLGSGPGSGNYSIYSSSAYDSYFAGKLAVAGASNSFGNLQVTSSDNFAGLYASTSAAGNAVVGITTGTGSAIQGISDLGSTGGHAAIFWNQSNTNSDSTVQIAGAPGGGDYLNISDTFGGNTLLAFNSSGLTLGNSGTNGILNLYDNNGQRAIIQVDDIAADRTLTIPVATGNDTFCLQTLGNCTGGGVTAASPGSSGRLAVFTAGQDITSSWLAQSGNNLNLDSTRNLVLSGGNLSVTGTGSFSSTLTASGNIQADADLLVKGSIRGPTVGSGDLLIDGGFGNLILVAGAFEGDGKVVSIQGGSGSDLGANGGDVTVAAGDGDQDGGNIVLTPGAGINGVGGNVSIDLSNGGILEVLGSATISDTLTLGGPSLQFAEGGNRTLNIAQASSGAGNNLTIAAGQGATSGDQNGGNLVLQAGSGGGTGAAGNVILQGAHVGVGTASPTEMLEVGGNIKIGKRTDVGGTTADWSKLTQTSPGTVASGSTSGITDIKASAVYNGSLYVGTQKANAAEVYRYDGGSTWTKVSQNTAGTIMSGGTANIDGVESMMVFNGYLYIGTRESGAAEVYRYDGGSTWTKVSQNTAGTIMSGGTSSITAITAMTVLRGHLMIGTEKTNAAEVYRYDGGSSWTSTMAAPGQFGGAFSPGLTNIDAVTSLASSTSADGEEVIFAGTSEANAAEVYVGLITSPGQFFWIQSSTDNTTAAGTLEVGGTSGIDTISSLAIINGYLYIGTKESALAEIYVTSLRIIIQDLVSGGSISVVKISQAAGTISAAGGSTTGINAVSNFAMVNGKLYIGTSKGSAGEIYRYDGDTNFTKVSQNTAGTIASGGTSGIDTAEELIGFGGQLYVGTSDAGGAEIYRYTDYEGQSYSLLFNASSDNAGSTEQSGFPNYGAITFAAELQGNTNQGNINTGSFMFSHTIKTVSGNYDIAEDYATRDSSLQEGDIVSVDPNEREFVVKSNPKPYDRQLLGVYSSNPALRLSQGDANVNGGRAVPIALAGRVPVKVSQENGPIKPGDSITTSSVAGVGMKSTQAGRIIGTAMEAFNGDGIGKIVVFVNPGYDDPSLNDLQSGVSQTSLNNLSVGDLHLGGIEVSGTLSVMGSVSFNGSLTVTGVTRVANLYVSGRIVSQGPVPAIIAGEALRAVSGSVSIDGTTTAGTISVTTSSQGVLGGELANVTFHEAYLGVPRIVISGNNHKSAKLGAYVVRTNNGFTLVSDDPLEPNTEYTFDYIVIGTQN